MSDSATRRSPAISRGSQVRTYSNNNQTWISAWSHRSQAVGKRGQGDCLTFICGSVERSLKQHRPFDSQCIQVDDQHLHRVTDLHILFCGDSNCCAELPCRMRPNVRVCVDPLPVRAATSGTTWACASYTASSVRGSWHRQWPVVATWHAEAFAFRAHGTHTGLCRHHEEYNPGPGHIPVPALPPAKRAPPAGRPTFTFGTDTSHTPCKLQATATTVPPSRWIGLPGLYGPNAGTSEHRRRIHVRVG